MSSPPAATPAKTPLSPREGAKSPRRINSAAKMKAAPKSSYDKAAAAKEAEDRARELAQVAKIKAEREQREKIEAECRRLGIPRLMAIKGVRRLRPVLMALDATYLARRDHFLLETETGLYHYKGEFAPFTSQRTKAVERITAALQAERMVKLKLESVPVDKDVPRPFWETLGGSKFSVGEGVGDNLWELKYNESFKLYRYDPEVGLLPEEEVTCGVLDKKSIFVINAPGELYVWYGKETGLLRRNQAKYQAANLPKQPAVGYKETAWIQLREIHQGQEDYLFRQKFPDWIEMSATGVPLDPQVLLEIFSRKMLDFNPTKINNQITDVDGSLDIWVAKDHGKVPISKVTYGEFYNGNSYIVLYQSGQGRVIYFWQGSESHVSWDHASDSIKAVQKIALSTVDVLRRKKTTIPVVRVVEGDEPAHLLALFNGAFIARRGKFDSFDKPLLVMFHVRGNDPFSCRVMECSLSRKALRSEDAFLLYSPKTMFVWRGKACGDFAHKVAKAMSERYVAMDSEQLAEGQETQEFWDLIGGKVEMKEMEKKRVKGRKCQKCSHGNPLDCKFCRKCGAPMLEQDPRRTPKMSRRKTDGLGKKEDAPAVTTPSPAVPPPQVIVESVGAAEGAAAPASAPAPANDAAAAGAAPAKKAVGKRCPKCLKGNPSSNRFCRKCGAPMSDVSEESLSDASQSDTDASKRRVSKRASSRPAPAAAAPPATTKGMLGAELVESALGDSSKSADAAAARRASRRNSKRAEPVGIRCGGCGKANAAGMKFCKKCGKRLGGEEGAAAAAPAAASTSAMNLEVPGHPVPDRMAMSMPLPSAVNKCGACAHINAPEDKFCLSCGAKLAGGAAAAPSISSIASEPTETQCGACGTWNEPGCKYCADCGETLVPKKAEGSAAAAGAATSTAVVAPPPRMDSPGPPDREIMVKCPKCRRPNASTLKFCRKCGTQMDSALVASSKLVEASTTTSESSDTEGHTRRKKKREASMDCRQCGKANPLGNVFCKKCGTRFAAPKRSPADEIATLRRNNSVVEKKPSAPKKERGVRCLDPDCAKPNRPGEKFCRVCGKELPAPTKETAPKKDSSASSGVSRLKNAFLQNAAGDQGGGGGGGGGAAPQGVLRKTDSSAFLNKNKDKATYESEVAAWLGRRDVDPGKKPTALDVSKTMGTLPRSAGMQKLAAMEAKAAAEKKAAEDKAAEEKKRKEEEEAAREARQWRVPKLFIIQDNAIVPKRNLLQVHLQNEGTQALLDNKDVVWVWLGAKTNPDQAKFATDLAKFYCETVMKESGRKATTKECKQYEEAPLFVKLFQGWEYSLDNKSRHSAHPSISSSTTPPSTSSSMTSLLSGSGSSVSSLPSPMTPIGASSSGGPEPASAPPARMEGGDVQLRLTASTSDLPRALPSRPRGETVKAFGANKGMLRELNRRLAALEDEPPTQPPAAAPSEVAATAATPAAVAPAEEAPKAPPEGAEEEAAVVVPSDAEIEKLVRGEAPKPTESPALFETYSKWAQRQVILLDDGAFDADKITTVTALERHLGYLRKLSELVTAESQAYADVLLKAVEERANESTELSQPLPEAHISKPSTPEPVPAPVASAEPAVRVCPSCGTKNDAVSKFCEQCATSLADAPPPVMCKSCGEANDPNCKFCAGCGESLAAAVVVAEAPPIPATPSPAQAPPVVAPVAVAAKPASAKSSQPFSRADVLAIQKKLSDAQKTTLEDVGEMLDDLKYQMEKKKAAAAAAVAAAAALPPATPATVAAAAAALSPATPTIVAPVIVTPTNSTPALIPAQQPTDAAKTSAATVPAAATAAPPPQPHNAQQVLGMYMSYFPLERLQDPDSLPPTLNFQSLEMYLTDEDFQRVFRMNRNAFEQQPAWKKVAQKKAVGLF